MFHRKAHVVSLREAAAWSGVWIGLARLFALGVFVLYGAQRGLEFTTGYLIEKALSVDNIFVIAILFGALRASPRASSTGCCSGASSARS